MRNHTGDRGSRAAIARIVNVFVIAVTLAGARTAAAQLSPPSIEAGVSRTTLCTTTVSSCDAGFASTLPWGSADVSIPSGVAGPQVGGSRSHWLIGAIGGFVVGATVTYFVLHSGGSTSKCDRDANQDALNRGECAGLVALGGLVGAGAGAFIGSRFRSDALRIGPIRGLEIGRMPNGRVRVATGWIH